MPLGDDSLGHKKICIQSDLQCCELTFNTILGSGLVQKGDLSTIGIQSRMERDP